MDQSCTLGFFISLFQLNLLCSGLLFVYSSLRKKCPYLELFWSVFFRIRTEYGEIRSISPYSVRMRENTDQNNSEYGLFLFSAYLSRKRQKSLISSEKRDIITLILILKWYWLLIIPINIAYNQEHIAFSSRAYSQYFWTDGYTH